MTTLKVWPARAAVDEIAKELRSSVAVTIRLLETIAVIAGVVHRPGDRTALRRHAEMIARGAREGLAEDEDRRAGEERYQTASRALCEPDVQNPTGPGPLGVA